MDVVWGRAWAGYRFGVAFYLFLFLSKEMLRMIFGPTLIILEMPSSHNRKMSKRRFQVVLTVLNSAPNERGNDGETMLFRPFYPHANLSID